MQANGGYDIGLQQDVRDIGYMFLLLFIYKAPLLITTPNLRQDSFFVSLFKGTKQLHEINIENKMECMKRIANIANLGKDMNKLTHREKISATKISNNDHSWDASFAMLVEYVGEKLQTSKSGGWTNSSQR